MSTTLLTFPQQASSAATWRTFLQTSNLDPAELLAYVFQLYERERVVGTRYHQVLLALAHLADGYTPTDPASHLDSLTQCVDCGQTVVVDGTDYGRLLTCGHVMHSFCMATYCEPADGNAAPGCRRCGVRFFPSSCNPRSQLQVATVLTAVRVKNGTSLATLRQDFQDNGYTPVSELDRLIMADDPAVHAVAQTVLDEHKAFLRQLAQTVTERLVPTLAEPRPFPALPTATLAAASAAEPAAKKPYNKPSYQAAPMPPTLEPDVLPPVGAEIPKGSRFLGRTIMFTSFSSKCKLCKRAQEQGRTIIASGEQGFACGICVFGKTSAAIYSEAALTGAMDGKPTLDSML